MTFKEAQRTVASISYKAGWTFSLRMLTDTLCRVEVEHWEVDVTKEDRRPARLLSTMDFALAHQRADFLIDGVREMVKGAERHEFEEWWTVDGQRPLDPHAPEPPQWRVA